MTSLALAQPGVAEGRNDEADRSDLATVAAARAVVVALQRARLTGLPVEIRHADHPPLAAVDAVDVLKLAEAICEQEQTRVRIRWTDGFDGFVFEPQPQLRSEQDAA